MSNYTAQLLSLYGNSLAYYSEVSGLNTIEYFCFPVQPYIAIADTGRKVMRMTTVTIGWALIPWKCIMRAGGTPDHRYTATDLNTVKAYAYS
jgi:hypothetical protein